VLGPCGFFLSPFLLPLVAGAVICAVAAAVRGRPVTFNQCWQFTQPRFGGMLVSLLLGYLVLVLVCVVLSLLCIAISIGAATVFSGLPENLQFPLGFVGFFLLALIFSVVAAAFFCWANLAAIVAAMEEDKRNAQALGRAWEMLRGNWVRVVSLMSMLMLGYLVLSGICLGAGLALAGITSGIGGLRELLTGNTDGAAFWITYFFSLLGQFLLGILGNPIQFLLIAIFYLDVRVRNEALDIEWTAHQSTAPPGNMPASQLNFAASTPTIETPNIEPMAVEPMAVEMSPPAPLEVVESGVYNEQICPQCGARNAADLEVCATCGTRLKALW